MKTPLLIALFFFFSLLSYSYDLTIGTNSFCYVFEDQTLSTQMQNRILDDLKIMQMPWTNRSLQIYNGWSPLKAPNAIGRIRFENISFFPFLATDYALRDIYIYTNQFGARNLMIPRKFSDDYANAIYFIDAHQDAWNERTNFLDHFTKESITNTPLGGFKELMYGINVSNEEYIRMHNDIAQHLLNMNYHQPNMLGMATRPAGFLNYPEEALWLALPVSNVYLNKEMFDVFFCVWRNGHWYYWSMAWID